MSQDLPAGGQLRAPIPVPGPMFEIDDLVDPAPDTDIKPGGGRPGKVDSRAWVEYRDRKGYWRYTVKWPEGGFSTQPEKDLSHAAMPAFREALRQLDEEVEADKPRRDAENARQLYTDDVEPKLASEIGKSAAQVDAERNAERSAPRREKTSERLAGESEVEVVVGSNPHLPEGYADKVMADLAEGKGWKGTRPAEGTRRKLILDTLLKTGLSVQPNHRTALRFADDVESALLQTTIEEEEKESRPLFAEFCLEQRNSHKKLRDTDPSYAEYHRGAEWAYGILAERASQMRFLDPPGAAQDRARIGELEDQLEEKREEAVEAHRLLDLLDVAKGPEISPPTVLNRLRELYGARPDYSRDDRWAQLLAMAAIVAGQECDVPFPAEVLDDVLRDFSVRPSTPRTWPSRSDRPATETIDVVYDIVDEEAMERGAEALTEGIEKVDPDGEYAGESYEDRLLRQREEARVGESRFAEERDAAYALLRWLLPVRVATRIDDDEEGSD